MVCETCTLSDLLRHIVRILPKYKRHHVVVIVVVAVATTFTRFWQIRYR